MGHEQYPLLACSIKELQPFYLQLSALGLGLTAGDGEGKRRLGHSDRADQSAVEGGCLVLLQSALYATRIFFSLSF